MKRNSALLGMTLMMCSLALAQDTGERVVVPARNTTQPRKVDVNLMGGSITVKAYAGKEVIVEARGSSGRPEREREPDKAAEGMRRLDLPARGLSVEEENNVVTVRMQRSQRGELVISVPPDTSLKLHTMHGEITVEGVKGELDINSMNGKITLANVSGSVLANTMNGTMKISMDARGREQAALLQQHERHHRRHAAGGLQGQRETAHRPRRGLQRLRFQARRRSHHAEE